MYEDPAETDGAAKEEEEEVPAKDPPTNKKKKLMSDAMKPCAPKPSALKKPVAPKRTTKDILAAAKEKGIASKPFAPEEDVENAPILMKLRSHLPVHNEANPIAEDIKKITDVGLRKSREDWNYIKANEHFSPHVRENFNLLDIE
ncbi:hypothetical protein D1007_02944 [Hordeum vulgare]|nr:hypothetical protein D1007_02944 [Hordeum vulgare]